jgi:hypothetical protein
MKQNNHLPLIIVALLVKKDPFDTAYVAYRKTT